MLYIPKFDWIKCPLHRYTFEIKNMKNWVEEQCVGKVLNLFAGNTILDVDEIRNDTDPSSPSGYHLDALEFVEKWQGNGLDTIILDPPYAYRKSMEMYGGRVSSPFNRLKDALVRIINPGGRVITFGYHSVSMGKIRGFRVEGIAVFSHGGAIHDTIATVEVKEE